MVTPPMEAQKARLANMPSVAVVILNYNGKTFLERFLPVVIEHSRDDAEIIVADNASTDGSLSMMAEKFPEIRVIINPVNKGFSNGYNLSLKQVQADYFVLLNSDIEVTPNWISPLIEFMESDKQIAACQPKSWILTTNLNLNMPALEVDLSTNLVILFAADACFSHSKQTRVNMTIP